MREYHRKYIQFPCLLSRVSLTFAGVTGNSVPPNFRSGGPTSLGNSVPPPPGPKSLDAQNQLNRTHFPRELSPPRTEIPVRIYYTLVHVHQKLARFDSRVKWRVVGKVFVMKHFADNKTDETGQSLPCRRQLPLGGYG